jgi:rhodanese-related sulfurtransferase
MFQLLKKLVSGSSLNVQQIVNGGAVIVDVRTPLEFKSGHLPGSINIPLDILPSRIGELKKMNKTIVTVCRSGSRSNTAKNILVAAGLDACNGGPWTSLKHAD